MKRRALALSASIISGADGPTSVFIAGRTDRAGLAERVRRACYKRKRRRAERRIDSGKLTAAPHTLEETVAFIKQKYHVKEVPADTFRYQEQYGSLRAALIIQHRPELLGDLAKIRTPDGTEEADLKEYWRQIELRDRKAREVPEEIFSLDYHIYEIEDPERNGIQIETEEQWGILGVSFSGSKKAMKRFRQTAKEIYLYYGVSTEDIRTRSDRYRELVTELCL